MPTGTAPPAVWIVGSSSPRPESARTLYADGTGGRDFRPEVDVELSHWIPNRTPLRYKADTSTAIALRFVADPEAGAFDLVVNNHADIDGVLTVFTLCDPETARAHADTLIAAATMGDLWGWGPPPAQAVFQGLACALRDGPHREDPSATYERCCARVHELLARGPADPAVDEGVACLERAEAWIADGRIARRELAPRLTSYVVPRAVAETDPAAALRCPEFSTPLGLQFLCPPHARNQRDAQRLHTYHVETSAGWHHDLCWPGYLWADTVDVWRTRDPLVAGPGGGRDALADAVAGLQAVETGPGRWTMATGTSANDNQLPGRAWPVVCAFMDGDRPAPSRLTPEQVAAFVRPLAG